MNRIKNNFCGGYIETMHALKQYINNDPHYIQTYGFFFPLIEHLHANKMNSKVNKQLFIILQPK